MLRCVPLLLGCLQGAESFLVRPSLLHQPCCAPGRSPHVRGQAATDDSTADTTEAKPPTTPPAKLEAGSFYAGFAAAAGILANPVVFLSLYNVAATGKGLPAGPYDLVGTLEGVSFLIVTAIVGAASLSKVTTGSGLASGPLGLLGLSEGLSFLSLFGALLIFPLRELGIVGNPETAVVNVPELAESVRLFAAPLIASAVSGIADTVQKGVGGELPSIALPEGLSVPSGLTLPDVRLPTNLPSLEGLQTSLQAAVEGINIPDLPTSAPSLPDLPSSLPSLDGLQSKMQTAMDSLPKATLPEGVLSDSPPSSLDQVVE